MGSAYPGVGHLCHLVTGESPAQNVAVSPVEQSEKHSSLYLLGIVYQWVCAGVGGSRCAVYRFKPERALCRSARAPPLVLVLVQPGWCLSGCLQFARDIGCSTKS